MFCGNCGKNFDDDNDFCPYCGSKVELIPSEGQVRIKDNSDECTETNRIDVSTNDNKKKGNAGVIVISIAIVVCLLGGLAFYLIKTGRIDVFNNIAKNESLVDEEENVSEEMDNQEYYDNYDEDSYYVYGNSYRVMTNLRVREGPGKEYRILQRDELSSEDYDISVDSNSTTDALIEKGSTITCLGMEGDWMQISSGWVCVYDGEVLVR